MCNFKRLRLFILLIMTAFICNGCKTVAETEKRKVPYELCTQTMLPDELLVLIEDKKDKSFAFSYSTNDYTYIAVGYGMHDRDGYVVWLNDIFATDYACYVKCSIVTQDYIDSLGDGVYICSSPSMYPYLVLRCKRLSHPVMFASS